MRFGFQLGFDRSGNRGGRPSLNFGAVAIIIGDSNAAGSAQTASENAFAASYVPDPKIRTVNTAGALVTWTPNVHCGLRSLADSGRPGYEAGFVQRWKQDFPNDPLVILRFGNPGACASRGPTTGTMTASFSGNQVTRTAGVALTTTQLLRGTGLAGPNGRGIHTLFQNGGNANNWYVGEVRNAANINLGTLASFTFDTYNAFLSWSLNEGDIYNGLSNNPTGGVRARVSAALSALTSQGYNPRVVAVGNWIGANDVATTEAAGLYQAAVTELYTDMRSTWSLEAACPIVMPKIRGGTNMSTVAAAQTAIATADDKVLLTETSAYPVFDGTHFDMTYLLNIGADMFNAVKSRILAM